MACKHCEHEHCEIENERSEKKEKLSFYLYIIGIILFLISFYPFSEIIKIGLITASILLTGYELLLDGIKNLFHFQFSEDTLMTIAVVAAFCLGEYMESCLVIILYRIGEILEDRAVDQSEESIEEIVKIKADMANRVIDNTIETVSVEEIKAEETILIKPGEKVPLDCIVIYGESEIDTSAITGESTPVYVKKQSEILSGGINLTGAITCKVLRDVNHSAASQIVNLVYEAKNNKGKTEKFITRFSKIYTPTVILIALAIAVIPASFGYLDYATWISRALIFLVASCPCSLVISVPLSFFRSVGVISKKGMIVKGTKHIENLAKSTVVAFDKTGTLTTGKMKLEQVESFDPFGKEEVLAYMYALELLSNHPIGTAIKEYEMEVPNLIVEEYKEIPGHGLYGKIENKEVLFGNCKLLEKYEIEETDLLLDAIYLVIDGKLAGYITLGEEIRKETNGLVEELKKQGTKEVILLTGDHEKSANEIAKLVGVDQVYSGLLPQDKLKIIEEKKQKEGKVIFVGDGINDGPVLAASDFGIAMGAGASIASITADSILISNNIGKLPEIIKTSKKAMRVVRFNIAFSLMIKAFVLVLGAVGIAPIWLAILADTGVTALTVMNAIKNIK